MRGGSWLRQGGGCGLAMVQLEEPPPYLLCAVALPSYSMCLCGVTRPAQGPSGKLASQRLLGCLSSHVPQHIAPWLCILS